MSILISYRALRKGGACADGLRAHVATLRRAGVAIPRRYSTAEIPLLTILDVLGLDAALAAASYVRGESPRLRLFATDCAEWALLRERAAGRESDPRSWTAVECARAYARGRATAEELVAAWDAAGAAARYAGAATWYAGDAAWAAAGYVAGYASWPFVVATVGDAERRWQAARLRLYLTDADLPPVGLEAA